MAEQQLVDYIKKAKEAGQADDQTRSILLKNGWMESEIAEAFSALAVGPQTAQPQNQPQPQQSQPQPQQSETYIKPRIVTNSFADLKQQTAATDKPSTTPSYTQEKPSTQPRPAAQPKMQMTRQKGKGMWAVIKAVAVLVVIAFLAGGAYFTLNQFGVVTQITEFFKTKSNEIINPNPPVKTEATPQFAKYELLSTPYSPKVPDYTLAIADITNLSAFEKAQGAFSKVQKDALVKDNFFLTRNFDKFYSTATADYANRNDDWTGLYSTIGGPTQLDKREAQNSVFISSDFTLHVYHKLLEQEFEYIEQANLYPVLQKLSADMLSASAKAYSSSQDPLQKESFDRLSAYFLVSSSLLDNALEDYNKFKSQYYVDDSQADKKENVLAAADRLAKEAKASDTALSLAKGELSLILDSKMVTLSPLFGKFQQEQQIDMPEDYTQYTPRSHYAKNAVLRDYFRAMMWFGRTNFLVSSPQLTRDATNLTLLLSADNVKNWELIYQPTSFFVEKSDDLGIYDYKQAIKNQGVNAAKLTDEAISKLQAELKTYKDPQIMSSVMIGSGVMDSTKSQLLQKTKGFRFMGQRFTPDAFIFSTMTQGDEKADQTTKQSLPSTPTALMVSALMGSKESEQLLDTWIKNNAPNSDKVIANKMNELKNYFSTVKEDQWTSNIYWSWLYTLKSLVNNNQSTAGYPMFLRSASWTKKNLQCFLGSWTELKHDTLLYAKQSYAEKGAGGEEVTPAPVPKGYVEPNVEFYDRLIALANLTTSGLKNLGLLPSSMETKNAQYINSLNLFKKIAVAELQNEKISDEDFESIRMSGLVLDNVLSPISSEVPTESRARSALIADVHTDAKEGKILYEADGIPNYIYVAVKDQNGTRLTKGLVFSYYEFTNPLTKRLTDQDWQKWNYSSSVSKLQMPFWTKDLVK